MKTERFILWKFLTGKCCKMYTYYILIFSEVLLMKTLTKKILAIMICLCMCISMPLTGMASENLSILEPVVDTDISSSDSISTYIVVLEGSPVHSPNGISFFSRNTDEYHNALRQSIKEMQDEVLLKINEKPDGSAINSIFDDAVYPEYSYTDVLNGFTVQVDAKTADKIRNIDGVRAVVEDAQIKMVAPVEEPYELTETDSEENSSTEETAIKLYSGNMINVDTMYKSGYNGEGRAIAIIDSELDTDHSFFKLTKPETAKFTMDAISNVMSSYTLNCTEVTADNVYKNEKIPFAYNYVDKSATVDSTTTIHGSHVSGIAAGNKLSLDDGVLTGMAPEAQILFFKVFAANGYASASTIIAAIDDAVKFGVDAINLSLGVDFRSDNFLTSLNVLYKEAVENAEAAGCSVVFAAGNSNKGETYETSFIDYNCSDNLSYQSSAKVGSVQNEYIFSYYIEDENANKYPVSSISTTTSSFDLTEIVNCGFGTAEEIADEDVSGKVAVISMPDAIEGNTTTYTYATRAINAGATAVIIINSKDSLSSKVYSLSTPVFLVNNTIGTDLLENASKVKYESKTEYFKSATASQASVFSSYAYADNLDIAVDFAAPGGNILSSWPNGGTKILSGTSMSAPHVTGVTSLMYQFVEADEKYAGFTGKAKVDLVRNLLASTAKTIYDSNGAIASSRKVGAGLIQLDKAISTNVVLTGIESDSTKVTLGDKISNEFEVSFTAKNYSENDITFDKITAELSTDDYKYYESVDKYGFRDIKKLNATISGDSTVNVPANDEKSVTVKITLSQDDITYLNTAMVNGFFVDGKITLSSSTNDNCDVGIPFTGFYGDWSSQPVFYDDLNNTAFYAGDVNGLNIPISYNHTVANGEHIMYISQTPDALFLTQPFYMMSAFARNIYIKVYIDDELKIYSFMNKYSSYMATIMDVISKFAEYMQDDEAVMRIEARLPYDTEGKNVQTLTIKFLPDNDAPVLNKYTNYTSTSNVLVLKASDNNNGCHILVKSHNTSTNKDTQSLQKSLSNEKTHVISAPGNYSYIDFSAYDSALNATHFVHDINISVDDNKAVFTNDTHKNLTGVCIIAKYEDDMLQSTKILSGDEQVTIPAYRKISYDISDYEGTEYKIFFWDSVTGVVPHCESFIPSK